LIAWLETASADMSMYGNANDASNSDRQPRIKPATGAMERLVMLLRAALTNRPTDSQTKAGIKAQFVSTCLRMKKIQAAAAAW
jgi:hypothetical protein